MCNLQRFMIGVVGAGLLTVAAPGTAASSVDACSYLPAEKFGAIMGYSVTATSTETTCTYLGSGSLGGQFRILAHAESPAAAEAALKRMSGHGPLTPPSKGRTSGTVGTSGSYVFSIYMAPADEAKLKQLVEELRRTLK